VACPPPNTIKSPATDNTAEGEVVPMPNLPCESMIKAVEVALREVVVDTRKIGLVPAEGEAMDNMP